MDGKTSLASMSTASNKRPAYSPDLSHPNTVGAAHPTKGVQPRFPHVSPGHVAAESHGLTEAGPGNPSIRSSLKLAAEMLPRRPGNPFEGAANGGASAGKQQPGDKGAMAPSVGRPEETRESPP
jgi:hypothetical protein